MVGRVPRPSHLHTARLGAGAASTFARPGQLTLKLGQPAKHGQHRSAVRARGVGPCVTKGSETGPAIGDRAEGIQEIPRRSRQPAEPRHHRHVTDVELGEFRAVGLGSARCLTKNLFASGDAKLAYLHVNALAVRRDPSLPVNHGFIMHPIYAPKRPFNFNAPVLMHKS